MKKRVVTPVVIRTVTGGATQDVTIGGSIAATKVVTTNAIVAVMIPAMILSVLERRNKL